MSLGNNECISIDLELESESHDCLAVHQLLHFHATRLLNQQQQQQQQQQQEGGATSVSVVTSR
jgi:hypothetical protein